MDRPRLTLPAREAALLRRHYETADVILEYGAGGSTVLAAELPGKQVFSVESDRGWALGLQQYIDGLAPPSPPRLYHVDIGPTGAWGRPRDLSGWRRFHRYPLAIWDEPFFQSPDVILIDGRFRPACLVAAMMRITRPATVLFDDYRGRRRYHRVEHLITPAERVGRMAVFRLVPDMLSFRDATLLIGFFSEIHTTQERVSYAERPE